MRRAFVLPLLVACGCAGAKNTEIMVAIDTDLQVPKDLNALTVEVFAGGQRIASDTYVLGSSDLKLPATIGVVPNDSSKLSPVDVVITGRFGAEPDETLRKPRVTRKTRLLFAKDAVRLARIPLEWACYDGPSCGDGQTCVAGACVATPVLDAASLPEWSSDAVFGQCWDPAACLAAPKKLEPTATRCVYAASGASLTVVLAGGSLGACSGGTCRIALDHDAAKGWEWDDASMTRVRLAQPLCDKVEAKKLVVEGVETCKTKVKELALCGG